LKVGLKVFAEKGYRGAIMDDIALELEATEYVDDVLQILLDGIAGERSKSRSPEPVNSYGN